MKHIKYFESHNKFYQEIEYSSEVDTIISMEKKYIDKLLEFGFVVSETANPKCKYLTSSITSGIASFDIWKVNIYQLLDEYFEVIIYVYNPKIRTREFKCDQFDGVLELLKHSKIID